jgi:hypothetical protein
MSSHAKNIRSIIKKLVEVRVVVDEEDSKAILLNHLPPKYNSVIFTPIHLLLHILEEMIAKLLVEEKITTECDSQLELVFSTRKNLNRSAKDREEI